MSVDVIIPYAGRDEHREQALAWVRKRYVEAYGWDPIVASYNSGPWRKAIPVRMALNHSDADTIVIADADVWVENLGDYVQRVEEGEHDWACPQIRVVRFTAEASERIYNGEEPVDVALDLGSRPLARTPYKRMLGGGLVVLKREVYERCPLDPRFLGWGGEDHAWGYALLALGGDRIQGRELLWHLWHPPTEQAEHMHYTEDNNALFIRYQAAAGNVAATQALVDEGRAWALTSSS